mmetsp:Transcript_18243/g.55022  ORF Transcript_18243/g.55022 Transcript_18243/m.55022 type:complete len:230 (-) Transcript_18243:919-1608(-)
MCERNCSTEGSANGAGPIPADCAFTATTHAIAPNATTPKVRPSSTGVITEARAARPPPYRTCRSMRRNRARMRRMSSHGSKRSMMLVRRPATSSAPRGPTRPIARLSCIIPPLSQPAHADEGALSPPSPAAAAPPGLPPPVASAALAMPPSLQEPPGARKARMAGRPTFVYASRMSATAPAVIRDCSMVGLQKATSTETLSRHAASGPSTRPVGADSSSRRQSFVCTAK